MHCYWDDRWAMTRWWLPSGRDETIIGLRLLDDAVNEVGLAHPITICRGWLIPACGSARVALGTGLLRRLLTEFRIGDLDLGSHPWRKPPRATTRDILSRVALADACRPVEAGTACAARHTTLARRVESPPLPITRRGTGERQLGQPRPSGKRGILNAWRPAAAHCRTWGPSIHAANASMGPASECCWEHTDVLRPDGATRRG
jgi:hypothetical protein